MNTFVLDQVRAVVPPPVPPVRLACESSLRVAAALLANSDAHQMTATRVVGTVGRDDVDALQALLAEIDADHGLGSRLEVRGGSFAVRFWRD